MARKVSKQSARTPRGARGEAVYSEDGVDLTLIRWMLSLTPTERLEVLQENIRAISRLRSKGVRIPRVSQLVPITGRTPQERDASLLAGLLEAVRVRKKLRSHKVQGASRASNLRQRRH